MNARIPQRLLAFALLALAVPAAAAQPVAWQAAVEIAAGRGERGPWRQNESAYDYVDDPTVALDEGGAIVVAWVEQRRKDVLVRRIGPDGQKPGREPVDVSRSPETFSWLPRIALGRAARDDVYILWQEIIFSGGSHGGDILFARSGDGGRTFAKPVNLSRSIGGDGKGRIDAKVWHNGSLDLAAGGNGALYAAWTEYDGPLWFARSLDGGRSFSRPVRLAGDGRRPARAPSLAAGRGDRVYLAWTVGEDDAADISVAGSEDAGATFGRPRIVERSSGYSDAPKLVTGPDETLHLVYAESDGGPFGRYHIRHTRSTDGARTFAASRALTKPASGSQSSAAFPALGVDAENHLYVLWETYDDPRRRPRGLALAVSRDGGETFTAPEEVPGSADPSGGSNGSHQGLLMQKLAVNRGGALAVVNSSLVAGERSRVWLIRGARARR